MPFRIVGIGEALWDLLPGGRQMGGAPANFAYHARELGGDVRMVSRVGADALGRELLARLHALGIPTDGVETDPDRPTGTVTVTLEATGEPQYTIHEGVAWDNLRGEPPGREAVAAADAVCFGTLGQRSEPARTTIRDLVRSAAHAQLRILDVNLRQRYWSGPVVADSLALANVLKLNETELPRLADLFALTGDVRAQLSQLADRHGLRVVAYTRGGAGSLLMVDGRWSDHPGVPTTVADTVGAGDSFTAALAHGLLRGWAADAINARANAVAAFVASRPGGTPPLPDDLRWAFVEA